MCLPKGNAKGTDLACFPPTFKNLFENWIKFLPNIKKIY